MRKSSKIPGSQVGVFFVLLFSILFQLNGFSQNNPDSLSLTRDLLKQGNFKKAYSTIKTYSADHPGDFNTTWLYAYSSYFMRHFRESERLYKLALRQQPGNYYLMLDYARMLSNTGNYNKALPMLEKYLVYDQNNGLALITRARIEYYQADYRKAMKTLNEIPASDEIFSDSKYLEDEIRLASAPWISAGMGYAADDQPLTGFFPSVKAGWSLHPKATVSLDLQAPVFHKSGETYYGFWGKAGNKFFFAKPRIGLDITAGLLKFPEKNTFTWTGSLDLNKTMLRSLVIDLKAERNPYFSTSSSIDSSVIENHGSFSVGWLDVNSWNGNLTAEAKTYPIDHNLVWSVNGWALTPPVKVSVFDFRFGLGYNYSTSRKNNFVSEKSLAEILQNYDSTAKIKGIYNPYFTPKDQNVASVIFSAFIRPARFFDININANFGAYSFAQIPYLYLNKDLYGRVYIAKGFVRENYFPLEASVSFGFRIADNIRLQADYNFSSTYYFIRHYAGMELKINLVHGRKKG